MATWQVNGLGSDHTQAVQISVKDFIKNNWSLTGELTAGRILFSNGWYDRSRQYQIHFRHDSAGTGTPYTLGVNGLQRFDDIINIHFFVTQLKSNSEPAALDKMYNEVMRIIGSNRTGLESSQGICAMWFIRPPYTIPQQDSEQSLWHGVGTLSVRYYKLYI